jgi:hypothetical protein
MFQRILCLIRCLVALILVILALGSNITNAQVLYGSLTGNVTDPHNAAIANAKVEALNVGTGNVRQTTTDDRGVYLFSNVASGVYTVTVAMPSFRKVIESSVQVNSNEVRRVDVQLQISQTSETVEVSASSVVLQTDKADVHAEITATEVEELPYTGGEGKNFQSLLYLIPGAGIPATREANSEAGNPQRAQTLFMNGVSSTGNNTKIDGATVAYPWLPVNIAYVPPVESIQTVNVSTNAFDAEQGAAGGAAVSVAIKSGTNQFHGVLFERNQNNDFTAVNYFSHTQPINKNIFNQFGFALGGPVWIPKVYNGRNKLFFFLDYQGTRRSQFASATNLTLPTAAERTGDFSNTALISATIYDPLTGNPNGSGRSPFPGNVIPTNRIATASATLTALLPALTRPNLLTQNYDAYADTTYSRDNWDYKVNYNPTDRAMVFGRYSFSPMSIFDPLDLGPAGGDAFNGGNPGLAGGLVQTTSAGFTYTVSPTFLIDGNVGYTRQSIGANGDVQDGNFGLTKLNIPGTNGIGPNYAGIPSFQITGVNNLGNASTGSPFKFRDNQYTTAINISKIKGAHSLRFGFEYDKYALNHFQPQGGTFGTARGTFGFDGTLTAQEGGATVSNPVNSFASFLLGYPSETGKVTQFQDPNSLRFSNYGLYARDQWQVSSKLTVSYGMRWEYYPIFAHDNYGAVRFDPSTDAILIGGEGGVPWNTGASASKTGFAPRFGAAYRLGQKTVIRSGYGISIDPDNMRNQRNAFPSIVNQVYQPANTYQFITYPGVPQVALSNGIPPPTFPTISQGKFTSSTTPSLTTYLPTTSTVTFPVNMDRGYVQSWNFFVQHEFSPTLTAEVGYVGTHAVHTMLAVNINGSAPGTGTAGRQLYPFLDTDLNSYEPYGSLKYNGLQTRLKKRIGASSLIGVSYTFSKAIDVGDNGDAALTWTYPVPTKRDEAVAGFDRPHTLQIYEVYQLPFGKGHTWLNHGFAAQVLGGFQISATVSKYSGLPFTVTAPGGSLNAAGQTQTANQILPTVAIYGGHDSGDPYFNTLAFAAPTGPVLGNTGRDILRGPGTFNMDANISRTFAIKELMKLQIAGEAFNLTNTPSFGQPGSGYTAPTINSAGQITSYNGFGVITSTTSAARILQVGATLRF